MKAFAAAWPDETILQQPVAKLPWGHNVRLLDFVKAPEDLAQQLIKDPYNFDFLTLGQEAHERDLERGLLVHIRQFLIELGVGFAFVGSQVPLQVGKEEFRIDLLFYHLKLRSFVVIDLKMTSFKPEYAGKMNFYLSAVDDMLRYPGDNPSIGLILCKGKEGLVDA